MFEISTSDYNLARELIKKYCLQEEGKIRELVSVGDILRLKRGRYGRVKLIYVSGEKAVAAIERLGIDGWVTCSPIEAGGGSSTLTIEQIRPISQNKRKALESGIAFCEEKLLITRQAEKELTAHQMKARCEFWGKWKYRLERLCPHEFNETARTPYCKICGNEKQERDK